MKSVLRFLREYTLPLSMFLGVIGYKYFNDLEFLLKYLIFFMLFFTFCKVNPIDLRLHRWHWLVLLLQIVLTVVSYYVILPFDPIVAQGVMLCFIMPTATAGPIIAGKLGGSIQSLTSFTLLSNLATAVLVPLWFPIVNPSSEITFSQAVYVILGKLSFVLICPFVLAWLIRLLFDAIYKVKGSNKHFHLPRVIASMPFYLWAVSLVILMANITNTLITTKYDLQTVIWQVVISLFACVVQFYLGKRIGERYPSQPHGEDYDDVLIVGAQKSKDISVQTRISAGQAFGQKNTTLAIWMANWYLNPLASIGAAAYIVWQNIINSWQLARAAHGKKV